MKARAILLLIAALVLTLAVTHGDAKPTTSKQELHCGMVQMWNETSGEFGWPDYNNTAAACRQQEIVR